MTRTMTPTLQTALLTLGLAVCLPTVVHAAPARPAPPHKHDWRREAVGRWAPERGQDTPLLLRQDGSWQMGPYPPTRPADVFRGRNVVTGDGSVRLTGGLGGTWTRRGDSLYAANSPIPWVRWRKETGRHHPPVQKAH